MASLEEHFQDRRGPFERENISLDSHEAHTKLVTLTYIEQLPPELLIEVFLYVRELCIADNDLYGSCVPVSHVCRRWRAIALGCCEFWNAVKFPCHPGYLGAVIERSKDLEIAVSQRNDRKTRTADVLAILPVMDRVATMELSLTRPECIASARLRRRSVAAPQLRELHDETVYVNAKQPFLAALAAPRLRKLTLFYWGFDQNTMALLRRHPRLTSLKLGGPTHEERTPIQLSCLLDALRHLPDLTELTIPSGYELDEANALSVAYLPKLVTLTLGAYLPECDRLLAILAFPARTRVHIIITYQCLIPRLLARGAYRVLETGLSRILHRVRANIDEAGEQPHGVTFTFDGDLCLTISRKPESGHDTASSPANAHEGATMDSDWYSIRLSSHDGTVVLPPMDMFPAVCQMFAESHPWPFAGVRELRVVSELKAESQMWQWDEQRISIFNGFRALSGVTDFHVQGWSLETIQVFLLPVPQAVVPPLHNLQTLSIFDAGVVLQCSLPPMEYLDNHPSACFHRLYDIVSRRKALGAAFKSLHIDCGAMFNEEELAQLAGQVSELWISELESVAESSTC